MSITIKVGLEQVWSINDYGYLTVEVCPVGKDRSLGSITLDHTLLIEDLEEDMAEADFSPLDWINLMHRLRELADDIEEKLNGESDDALI